MQIKIDGRVNILLRCESFSFFVLRKRIDCMIPEELEVKRSVYIYLNKRDSLVLTKSNILKICFVVKH